MNYRQLTLACLMLVISAPVFAQTPDGPKTKDGARNVIKLNFDGLFEGRYQFGYERVVGRFTSVQLTAGLIFDYEFQESANSINKVDNQKLGFVFNPEFRVYLSEFTNDEPPRGFYVGAFSRLRSFNEREFRQSDFDLYELDRDVTTAGVGLHLGIQYYTSFGVGFDAWIGPEFRFRNEQTDERWEYTDESWGDSGVQSTRTRIQETVVFAGIGVVYAF